MEPLGRFRESGEGVDVWALVFFDEGLELRDLFAGCARASPVRVRVWKAAWRRAIRRPGQLRGIGETLGFVGEEDCSSAETASGARASMVLPGTLVDEGVLGLRASASEKGHVRHESPRVSQAPTRHKTRRADGIAIVRRRKTS